MDYFELKIFTATEGIEPLSNLLMDLGYETFVTEDSSVVEEFLEKKNSYDWDYVSKEVLEKQYEESCITLYFEADEAGKASIKEIGDAVAKMRSGDTEHKFGRLVTESRLVSDEEWRDKWKEYFKPARISEHIVVRPSWETYEPGPDETVIEIDPGMAFGTGTHATTRMCVKLLEKYISSPDETVLDLGCGSGILSIAAALCGCNSVKGVDIDINAVEASRENVEKNGIVGKIDISYGDVTKGLGFKADIIAANLMAEMIVDLTPDIAAHLEGRNIFITSGILSEKKDLVTDALKTNGFEILDVLEEEGWCAIAAELA